MFGSAGVTARLASPTRTLIKTRAGNSSRFTCIVSSCQKVHKRIKFRSSFKSKLLESSASCRLAVRCRPMTAGTMWTTSGAPRWVSSWWNQQYQRWLSWLWQDNFHDDGQGGHLDQLEYAKVWHLNDNWQVVGDRDDLTCSAMQSAIPDGGTEVVVWLNGGWVGPYKVINSLLVWRGAGHVVVIWLVEWLVDGREFGRLNACWKMSASQGGLLGTGRKDFAYGYLSKVQIWAAQDLPTVRSPPHLTELEWAADPSCPGSWGQNRIWARE